MWTRRGFATAGFSMLAVAAMPKAASAQLPKIDLKSLAHNPKMDECAKACADCQLECDSCSHYCGKQLVMGSTDHATTLATCSDCADVCSVAAQIVSRSGPFSEVICVACADACQKCAEACESFKEDEKMKKCAAACRKCEKACRGMVKTDKK